MSDVRRLLSLLPRIDAACRSGPVRPGDGGPLLTAHQHRTLSQLDDLDPTMVTELADYMGVTPSTMSLNLKRLEERGLVTRRRDPEDRRVMNVHVTEAGKRLRDESGPFDRARAHELLARLSPGERRRALEALARLARAADELTSRRHAEDAARFGGREA